MEQQSETLKFSGAGYFRQRLVLSVISGRACRISNIRPDDEHPGLRDYEYSFLRLLDKICNGTDIKINHTGTAVMFRPGMIVGGKPFVHDCGKERSIGYFLEGIVCLSLFAKHSIQVTFTGITNEQLDPSVDIFRTVTLPLFKKFGVEDGMELKIKKRGAAPKGGGEVFFRCPIVKALKPVRLVDTGLIRRIRGIAYTTLVPPQMANRVVDAARGPLNQFIPDVHIYTDHYKRAESGESPGYGLTLVAETTMGTLLSTEVVASAGDLPEDVGKRAAELLFEEIANGGCVDTQHQSIAILLMVLCPEDVSKIRVGKLSPFAIQFLRDIKEFLGLTFKLTPDDETKTTLITGYGIGFSNIGKKLQ